MKAKRAVPVPPKGSCTLVLQVGLASGPRAVEYRDAPMADVSVSAMWQQEIAFALRYRDVAMSSSLFKEVRWVPQVPPGRELDLSNGLDTVAGASV